MATVLRGRRAQPIARPAAPRTTVLVRPEAVTAIGAAAAESGTALETGGPLIGTVQRSWDGLGFAFVASILATVPPGPAVRGGPASVSLGADSDGERAASAIRWLRSVTGLDLLHLGDWHKHPLTYGEPSAGDRRTAERMLAESGMPLWLVAVVVNQRFATEQAAAEGSVVTFAQESSETADVRFYQTADGLVPLRVRLETVAIPRLPPLPWHILDPARFAAECRLLDAAGFKLAIEEAAPGRKPELTLRLRRDGGRLLRAVTGASYPREEPVLVDDRGRRLPLRRWSSDRFLVDLLREVSW